MFKYNHRDITEWKARCGNYREKYWELGVKMVEKQQKEQLVVYQSSRKQYNAKEIS